MRETGCASRSASTDMTGVQRVLHVPFEDIARHRCMISDNLRRCGIPECDREDVMQEILFGAWLAVEAGRFHARENLSVKEAVKRWLHCVTWHHIVRYREHQDRWEKGRGSYTHPAMYGDVPPPIAQVEARCSLRCLERLDPAARYAVAVSALGYTTEETGAEVGKSPNTIQSRLRRGRAQLRRTLRSENAPTPLAIRIALASMPPLRQLNSYG
ncbi:hypothetical protein BE21_54530 [Sorangium cellulosum]|uniref:RNA polymerase sigma factor 70 region 4 type 2 domain-containing protein n=1 Tax=Sorangium cellulosum TaxID=56 RepID=A0A150TDQ0_SORCE|nr:hypothetical protein BE21_54530 [Sorangium cellulosum]